MNQFFDEPSPVISNSDGHFVMARKLAHVLSKKRLTQRQPNIQQWASHFQSLIRQHGEETVSRILDYYIGTIGKEYAIQAYSGKSFREKFDRIKERHDKDHSSMAITLTPTEQAIHDRIKAEWFWGTALRTLPMFVQQSYRNYSQFWAKRLTFEKRYADEFKELQRYMDGDKVAKKMSDEKMNRYLLLERGFTLLEYVSHYMEPNLNPPDEYVFWWAYWVYRYHENRPHQIRLEYFIWSLDNKHVIEVGSQAAVEYLGTPFAWDRLIELICNDPT